MYPILRQLIFRIDPENAHRLVLNLLRLAGLLPGLNNALQAYFRGPEMPIKVFGQRFKNPVGLAAGYDKDGIGWRGLALLGFGHIELGTVTPEPQPGNARPRLFRLIEDQALINRMGFPGRGAEYLAGSISGRRPADLVIGVNLGKNASTPIESALDDYTILFCRFAGLADYLVINISSPNTWGLLRLQARQALDDLLSGLQKAREYEEKNLGKKIPLLIKLSPDLSDSELEDALDVSIAHMLDGIVATNTTTGRNNLVSRFSRETGGLSGRPLSTRSTEIVRKIHRYTSGKLPVIGVGGVMSAPDAREKLDAGAVLVQVYTGLVYQGPGLVKAILEGF